MKISEYKLIKNKGGNEVKYMLIERKKMGIWYTDENLRYIEDKIGEEWIRVRREESKVEELKKRNGISEILLWYGIRTEETIMPVVPKNLKGILKLISENEYYRDGYMYLVEEEMTEEIKKKLKRILKRLKREDEVEEEGIKYKKIKNNRNGGMIYIYGEVMG